MDMKFADCGVQRKKIVTCGETCTGGYPHLENECASRGTQPAASSLTAFTHVALCMIGYVGCFVVAFFVSQQSGFKLASFRHQGVQKAESALLANCRRRHKPSMANSRFQYVKKFELSDALLPDTFLIARLDGHRFTKFTKEHGFTKPNDERGLLLMAEVGQNSTQNRQRRS